MKPISDIKTKVLAAVLTIAALAAGQTAWADATFQVPVGILGMNTGNQSVFVIASTYMQDQQTVSDTEMFFKNVVVNVGSNTVPITMSLYGTIEFANSSSATDVTVAGPEFKLTFTSTTKYFTNASVTTKAGAAVSGCSVSGKNSQTLTVTIPENTTFGSVVLTLATHTPLNHCTIGGIADSYIADGVNKPVPTVTLEGQTLRQDVDYTLSYSYGNTSGTVTVTGTGDYTGSKSQHYDIREPNLSDLHQFGDGAYEIATQQDLDYLARIVNGKGNTRNNCNGVTFRQTADIAYSYTKEWDYTGIFDSNFTPIGGFGKSFEGTYDGQGHTISGIRVRKLGSGNEESSIGLFGYISGYGTVKNVVLSNAQFWGYQNIGGIAGFIDIGSVTDCYLYHVGVRSTYSNDSRSILVGNKKGTVTRTHYRDCCEYKLKGYNDYNSSVFTLTPAANVVLPTRTGGTALNASLTTYADGLTLGGTEYYSAGNVLTLTYSGTVPTGQWPRFIALNGSSEDKTAAVIDGATLTMPAYDVAVHFDQLLPIVAYLDGDGNEQQCTGYTPITSSDNSVYLGATGTTGWYVVGSDATISGKLEINGDNVHLILCDGATLSISSHGTALPISGDLTIYGQQQGTGALNAESTSSAISCSGNIAILGGRISANSTQGDAIIAGSGNTITLGWTRPANSIYAYAQSDNQVAYRCKALLVKSGQTLYDGSALYDGDITNSIAELNGKTLIGVDVLLDDDRDADVKNADRIAALADGQPHNIAIQGRTLYRDGDWNTLCLPFTVNDFDGTPLEGATVMELDITGTYEGKETGLDGTTLNLYFKTATSITAGKPYIVKWNATGTSILNPVFKGVNIENSDPVQKAVEFTGGKFVGQYDPFEINAGNLNEIILLGSGNMLGYSSEPRNLHPFRAHFEVPVGNGGGVKAYQISFGDEGTETGIISIDNGKLTMDNGAGAWYDMSGRKLDGKPTQKGIYIHNGSKVVIK